MAGSGGDEGSGKMMGSVIFIAGFLIVVVFLMASFGTILSGPGNTDSQKKLTALGFSAEDLALYNVFPNANGGFYYNITPNKVLTYITIPPISMGGYPGTGGGWSNMSFTSSTGTNIRAYVLDTTNDFIGSRGSVTGKAVIFWCHSGWWDSHWVVLRYDDILAKLRTVNGLQKATLTITLDQSYTVFVVFPGGSDAKTLLETKTGYMISVGQSQTQSLSSSGYSGWNYIIGIMTFNIPNGGTGYVWFDVMLSIIIDASLLFIAFWALTRLIGALMP